MQISKSVKNLIIDALRELKVEIDKGKVEVEVPNNSENGDFSSNVAMIFARSSGKNPREFAQDIVNTINASTSDEKSLIQKIEIAGPGFINFYLNRDTILTNIFKANTMETLANDPLNKNQKVIVEHTSVNPNKAMHVGHMRNAFLGDSIARLMKRVGYKVEVQNYIDDTGLQVADTTLATMTTRIKEEDYDNFDDYCWDIYSEINKKYEEDEILKKRRGDILEKIEQGDNDVAQRAQTIVNKIIKCHLEELNSLGVNYDVLAHEKDVIGFGFWKTAFEMLKKSDKFSFVEDGDYKGCWVLHYEGNEGDKIFVRSNGTKVYTAKDTAYHMWKFGLLENDFLYKKLDYEFLNTPTYESMSGGEPFSGFGKGDLVINVIDERQKYPQEMVRLALKTLGYEKQAENYVHVAYGVVNLSPNTAKELGMDTSDNQSSYAMSGRKGIGVKSKDIYKLLVSKIKREKSNVEEQSDEDNVEAISPEQIAAGALRLYMLKNNYSSPVLFDAKEALSVEGFTGPYLQYSHARAKSILRKYNEVDHDTDQTVPSSYAPNEDEFNLIKKIVEWKDVLEYSEKNVSISNIAEYAFELCSAFNTFYHSSPILKNENINEQEARIIITKIFAQTLKDTLEVLGITAPERM